MLADTNSASLPLATVDMICCHFHLFDLPLLRLSFYRPESRFAPSQWKTVLLCNCVTHWLGASLASAVYFQRDFLIQPKHTTHAVYLLDRVYVYQYWIIIIFPIRWWFGNSMSGATRCKNYTSNFLCEYRHRIGFDLRYVYNLLYLPVRQLPMDTLYSVVLVVVISSVLMNSPKAFTLIRHWCFTFLSLSQL